MSDANVVVSVHEAKDWWLLSISLASDGDSGVMKPINSWLSINDSTHVSHNK